MSAGKDLQEMENPVTRGAKAAEPMDASKKASYTAAQASVENLGGPTPENYKPDDMSAALKAPSLATVKDIVNRGAKPAEAMPKAPKYVASGDDVELEDGQEVVAEAEEEEVQVNVDEDLAALFGGEELSEEFQEKAKTIFEAALTAKVSEVQESLAAEYEQALTENLTEVKRELVERLDSYLEYVADEWLTENAIEVEHGLKTEMTESFLTGMKGLFEDHYVSIPEGKYDVLESMVDKLDEMEKKLNLQVEKNISLTNRLAETTAEGIFGKVTEGLADTQKEKLASLAEGVEFAGEEEYREKLVTLRESYFPSTKSTNVKSSETLSEGVSDPEPETSSDAMAAYMRALSIKN
jgi:type III secretion system FlhB-like substrate exporter